MSYLRTAARWVLERFADFGALVGRLGREISHGDATIIFILMAITIVIFFLTLGRFKHRR
jgi:hypothetical protein